MRVPGLQFTGTRRIFLNQRGGQRRDCLVDSDLTANEAVRPANETRSVWPELFQLC